ncbi:P-type DNA transfer protein VirB5 [Moraxella caprae]|uniref:P-type DNA transfer protein VirB5 n=1 Tax=Moraxella caprae TaxID=90240 RepID=A0A378QL19_9GAMM|nr:type IV secretion system protein [Moraxella caprae]STZ01589.1 P-type DNA transfer protein VirB5 [Moraxella caprae]
MKVNFTKKQWRQFVIVPHRPCWVVMTSTTAHAITVFDPAIFARQLQQLNEAKRQYDQAKATYDQFRGSRDIGVLFNQYGSQMPKEMQDMYKDYQSGNWAGLADKVARLEKSQQLTGTQKEQLSQIANRAKMQALGNKVVLDDMFAKSNQRFAQFSEWQTLLICKKTQKRQLTY